MLFYSLSFLLLIFSPSNASDVHKNEVRDIPQMSVSVSPTLQFFWLSPNTRCPLWSTTGATMWRSIGSPLRTAIYLDCIEFPMVIIIIIMSDASSSTPLYVQCTGRGETASPRPVVYLQHCLTCSSAIWVFGISPSSWWLLSSPPASHEITIHAIYMQCHNFRPDFNGNQAPLKSPWPSFWRTLAMMFGWATAGETLIQGGLHHHSHHCHAHHDDHHNLKEPHDIRGLLIWPMQRLLAWNRLWRGRTFGRH